MELPNCDKCSKPVKREQGVLTISFKEVREAQREREAWEKEHPQPIKVLHDYLTYPKRINWKWGHRKCFQNSSYPIDATRLDSAEKVLHWTFHLMEKNWFMATDWRGAINKLYPDSY